MGATEHGVELAPLTTMRVGGPADTLVTAETLDEVVAAVRAADEAGTPLLLLSGGSNLVIADDGFRGTVVRIATKGVRVESTHDEHVDVDGSGGFTGRGGGIRDGRHVSPPGQGLTKHPSATPGSGLGYTEPYSVVRSPR